DSDERCRHAGLRQRFVHRLSLDDRDDPIGVAVHDERRSRPWGDEANLERTARRKSATIADIGYLGLLPCLTANTVNPFSFSGG
ncbi:MAG TPA: hypothetical protein VFU01_00005, partial [Gemmatimonadaceae bacterium]|nr:hypothetical protein [Gemmatimonadaceae bacterium]